jgi:hypothetical protein
MFPHALMLQGLYQVAQNMGRIHLLERCKYIPKDIKKSLETLRHGQGTSPRTSTRTKVNGGINGGKKYWSTAIKSLGCIERDGGVWFNHRRAGRLESPVEESPMQIKDFDDPVAGSTKNKTEIVEIKAPMKKEKRFSISSSLHDHTNASTKLNSFVPFFSTQSSMEPIDIQDEVPSSVMYIQDETKTGKEPNDLLEMIEDLPFMDHVAEMPSLAGHAVDESFFAKDFDDWAELNHVSKVNNGKLDPFQMSIGKESEDIEARHPPFRDAVAMLNELESGCLQDERGKDSFDQFAPILRVLTEADFTRDAALATPSPRQGSPRNNEDGRTSHYFESEMLEILSDDSGFDGFPAAAATSASAVSSLSTATNSFDCIDGGVVPRTFTASVVSPSPLLATNVSNYEYE